MDFLADARRRAFSFWLRTGRLPLWARTGSTERKYNPWHDPDDGRFTFAGTGRYFGRGSASDTGRSAPRSSSDQRISRPRRLRSSPGDGFNGPGAPDPERVPNDDPRPHTNKHGQDSWIHSQGPGTRRSINARSVVDDPRNWRTERRNGYTYRIDPLGRTRHVFGTLRLNPAQGRSPSAQTGAGGRDRRTSDQGGHYIGRRFDGPTEAFNHFAQDANFNRSGYLALENMWAREMRAGKKVYVSIEPVYEGSSQRPSRVLVSYWISGRRHLAAFPNEPGVRSRAKR